MVVVVRTRCNVRMSVHAHAQCIKLKLVSANALTPSAGLSSRQKPLRLFPPKAGSRRPQAPKKSSPNRKARKQIARHTQLALLSFGGRGAQSFPSPRR